MTIPVEPSSVSSTAPVQASSTLVTKPGAPYPVTTPAGSTATYPAGAAQPSGSMTYPAGAAQPSGTMPAGGYPVQTPPVVTAGAAKVGSGFLAIMVAAVAFL
ncbi:hypothetical protein PG999_005281 [Apiospora kogelbergensis]|uniref:Uncharacterized protein n=2 Tax=Apiospora kogelbergensis TaxID=1337665 RepID=A0AAW0R1Q6_9PEZI